MTRRSATQRFFPAVTGSIFAVILFCGAALAFSPGNIVVCRVGDGLSVLGNGATAVFIDEYTTAGAFVGSVAMPTSVSGNSARLTVSGTAASECQITRSTDGRYIIIAGYNAPVGTLNLAASHSTTIPRVIGRIDVSGVVDTSTVLSDGISGGSTRGAASTNGTDLWISGNGTGDQVSPVRYAAFGSTASTPVVGAVLNLRAINIYNGQLYAGSGAGSIRMAAVGVGTPTTAGQTLNALPGIPSTVSLNSFFFADLDAGVAGLDTLFAADDVNGVIRKYSFNGTSWVANGTIALAGAAGLTGVVNGSSVTLYLTNPLSLSVMTDSSGYNAAINGTLTTLASPPDRTEYRSVAFAPVIAATVTVNWGPRAYSRHASLTASNSGSGVKKIYFKLPHAANFQSVDGNSIRLKVLRKDGTWSFQAFVEDNAGHQSEAVTYTSQ